MVAGLFQTVGSAVPQRSSASQRSLPALNLQFTRSRINLFRTQQEELKYSSEPARLDSKRRISTINSISNLVENYAVLDQSAISCRETSRNLALLVIFLPQMRYWSVLFGKVKINLNHYKRILKYISVNVNLCIHTYLIILINIVLIYLFPSNFT